MCTHTALKRNVGFCDLGFLPLSKHVSHASKGCASPCWGRGGGELQSCYVIPKPFYKGGQSTEPVMKLTSPFSFSGVSSEPNFSELLTWNEIRPDGGNWASVPCDMTH